MQPGAGFVVDVRELSRLEHDDARDRTTLWIGSFGQTLDHQATAVHDLAARGARVAAVYATDRETMLLEADRAQNDLRITMVRAGPAAARRVAITEARWYVASDAEVCSLAKRTQRAFELVTVDPIDIAASPDMLCVLDERGITWFAPRDHAVLARQLLPSPTAVLYDPLARGWLVAADGDVLQIAEPSAAPIPFARGVGVATRIRRDFDALYAVTAAGELVEVLGVRSGPTLEAPRAIASYASGWSAFDACTVLYVDEGSGPRPFYHPTPCRCRTRRIDVLDRWTERRPDASYDHFERHRCPICAHTWEESFAG